MRKRANQTKQVIIHTNASLNLAQDDLIVLGIHEAPMTVDGDTSNVVLFPSIVFSSKGEWLFFYWLFQSCMSVILILTSLQTYMHIT